ncbi:unnamed protein product [Clonostachys chloroleuca]|uniref:Uncharacterized protein n=1 Tax=Clonostachys chloroleuca TaxID=1926264 RepID=A0AA35PVH6_9HYPO|nr:unnamed protein product [Clonostachys chloroleuca]
MGNDANAADPFQYDFTIPSDIPAGKGTIAWTWFNKIGNREMYMNCGPLTLTGAGGPQKNFDDLPDMFLRLCKDHPICFNTGLNNPNIQYATHKLSTSKFYASRQSHKFCASLRDWGHSGFSHDVYE